MSEKYPEVTGDEYWYRQGNKKCVCGHWDFNHQFTVLSCFRITNHGAFCHECKCPKFRHEIKEVRKE